MHKNSGSLFALGLILLFSSCSSAPKPSLAHVTEFQAKNWFEQYCSKGPRKQDGDILVKSSTKEFKGTYPADIRFDETGGFVLEVSNILGGTMFRLTSDGKEMETTVPPKPKYNRKHITHYIGLELPVLTELLLGDLPCPDNWKKDNIRVDGNRMQIVTPNWIWNFVKADDESKGVPLGIRLEPTQKTNALEAADETIQMQIEDWDVDGGYAKKVSIKSSEGELKWNWRNRNLSH